MKRVLFAGLFHETNTFVERLTGLSDFALTPGSDLCAMAGDSSPMGGAIAEAQALGWRVVPALDLRAMPSGMVAQEVVDFFQSELAGAARAALESGVDGVFLVLHGAMVSEGCEDVEGAVLEGLRSIAGFERLPVFGVFDLHANFTEAMAEHANGLVAYRENPHTDARESAVRAVRLMDRALSVGIRTRMGWIHPPLVWPPTGTGTASEPMRSLLQRAREWESQADGVWAVNVVAGFSFADTLEAGVSFSVCFEEGSEEVARRVLEDLAARAMEGREAGNVVEKPALEVVGEALREGCSGLTVIAEPADNIGGGGLGDGTGLLRVFLELGVEGAAVAIADPISVEKARRAFREAGGCACEVELEVGGRGCRWDAGPVALRAEVVSVSEGRFELEDKQSHLASASGDFFEMGPCAVVRSGGVTILLSSRPTPPMDLGQWTSQGLDPRQFRFLGVKAAVAHRRAYDPIAARMLWVDTAGPCRSRLATLGYGRLRRPLYPLDEAPYFESRRSKFLYE